MLKKAANLRQGYGRQASGVPCLRRSGFAFTRCSCYKAQARRQVGPLSTFGLTDLALFAPFALTYSVYAPGTKSPPAVLDLAPPKRLGSVVRAL